MRMICKECKQKLFPSEEPNGVCHDCQDKKFFDSSVKKLAEFLATMDEDVRYDYLKDTKTRWPLIENGKGFNRARSIFFSDTPKSLYRFLYLWEPPKVDFSDMYKSEWLGLIDLDGRGTVGICLFKCELSAYLHLPEKDFVRQDNNIVTSGIPGTEDVEISKSSKGVEEFSKLIGLLEMEHDVYPGNNFTV